MKWLLACVALSCIAYLGIPHAIGWVALFFAILCGLIARDEIR